MQVFSTSELISDILMNVLEDYILFLVPNFYKSKNKDFQSRVLMKLPPSSFSWSRYSKINNFKSTKDGSYKNNKYTLANAGFKGTFIHHWKVF